MKTDRDNVDDTVVTEELLKGKAKVAVDGDANGSHMISQREETESENAHKRSHSDGAKRIYHVQNNNSLGFSSLSNQKYDEEAHEGSVIACPSRMMHRFDGSALSYKNIVDFDGTEKGPWNLRAGTGR